MKENNNVFKTLNSVNCNDHTEEKNGLTYLSWAWAWSEVKKIYPDATYSVFKTEDNKPYIEDSDYGLMCMTTVTIEGQSYEMWLPVMDGANRAMRRTPYSYKVWNKYEKTYEEKTVAAATMFDINKTIMRCLVKNLAMFGLGLYIYAGEDLPEVSAEEKAEERAKIFEYIKNCETDDDIKTLWSRYKDDYMKDEEILNAFGARRKEIKEKGATNGTLFN